jgi:hypothetical protein
MCCTLCYEMGRNLRPSSRNKCLVCSFYLGIPLANSQNCDKFKNEVISMNETEGYTGIDIKLVVAPLSYVKTALQNNFLFCRKHVRLY